MTPRRYRLGRRAESAAATRRAIVDAAMAVYLEAGTARAPLKAIAERADVSRGTILHHFGDAGGLIDAVIGRMLGTLDLSDERILEGLAEPEARVRAYVAALVAFFRRTTPWWRVFESEMARPAAHAGEAEYRASMGQLQAAALGPELTADPAVQAALAGVLHPGTVGTLLWVLGSSGTSPDDAAHVVEDLVVGYLGLHCRAPAANRAARAGSSSPAGERREVR